MPHPLASNYRKYEPNGFATPSGRLELYSERLRLAGLDPLPDYVVASVPKDPKHPLTLTTAKWPQYCHSPQRNQPSLRRRMPEPLLELHPATAETRGINAGDWLEVSTYMGSMRARAKFNRHLAPEVLCAQYGWRQYSDGAGDANWPIDGEQFDPVASSNSLRNFPCQLFALPHDQ